MGMCILSLFSMCGCRKRRLQDGDGMVRALWSEFTISQSSDVYEQNVSYTVKYDEHSGDGYLYTEVPHETKGYPVEKSIRLKPKTVSALLNLDIMSFPDAASYEGEEEILDGTFLSFSVTDQNGNVLKKSLSEEMGQEILSLITPYANKLKKSSHDI